MPAERLIVRVPAESQEAFLSVLRTEEANGMLNIGRVSTWRSSGVPWTEILIALSSAGSLTAIGGFVKAWLDRTRGKIEIISEKTGSRVTFEGPLDRIPTEQIAAILTPTPSAGQTQ